MSMFHELDEDILLGVLSNCDVHAVLCVSRVSKLLRSIAMSKPLWLSLLADLASRSLMDAFQYSEITNCSTAELIQMVKRLVTGPETWSRRTVTPAVWREISVKPTSIRGGTNPTEYNIRLLPGGRHVMVEHHTGRFECWSVKTGSLVWTGAEFSIVHVDLCLGHSNVLFRMPHGVHIGFTKTPVLFGDFFSVYLRLPDAAVVLLVNWREERYIIFHSSSCWTKPALAGVPGHVILATAAPDPPYEPWILVYTLASLTARWRPASQFECSYRVDKTSGISPVLVDDLGAHVLWCSVETDTVAIQLDLHESSLRRGTYKLTLRLSGVYLPLRRRLADMLRGGSSRGISGALFFTFHVLPTDRALPLRLVQTSAVPAPPDSWFHGISYAGYSVNTLDWTLLDLHLRRGGAAEKARTEPVLNISFRCLHLSRSSGALTSLVDSTVMVSYYQ
ncbi:hypothetical protein B0H10DRAFT_2015140 [Mycena sp. CBHHK59/15]|nr:hypothetical protein B0H10DRAFT_2015140 [Mycena sp. CBHHK59/15]